MTIDTLKSMNWALAGAAATALAHGTAFAQDKIEFDIDAQELGDALNHFGLQSGKDVYFVESDVKGKRTDGLDGAYAPADAVRLLLDDANVTYRMDNGVVLVGEAQIRQASLQEDSRRRGFFRVAQADRQDDRDVERVSERRKEDEEDDVIVVTGTNIRGVQNPASPVLVFDGDDITKSGFATVQQFLQTVPQNFNSGVNENTASGLAAPGTTNITAGAGVNLRGLGTTSTLTLLNGKRLSPAGFGDVVDISIIPASAIDRVEILTDGASAVYGSDAIAGVTNIVLRDDFDGAETQFRYGALANSDSDEYRVAQTIGKNWSTGNGLVSYEYYSRDQLDSEDRDFSLDASDPVFLLPNQERHSVFANFRQALSERLNVTGEGFYSQRDFETNIFSFFTANLSGAAENYGGNVGLQYDLSEQWQLRIDGLYNRSQTENVNFAPDFDLVLSDVTLVSDIRSIDAVSDGKLLELPGGDMAMSIGGHYRQEGFKQDFGSGFDPEESRDIWAVFGEAVIPIIGESNVRPGIEDLQISVAVRHEDYSDFGSSTNPKVGIVWRPINDLKLRGTFSTSFRAPTFDQLRAFDVFLFPLADPQSATGTTPSLILVGGNSSLKPEQSEIFTVGFDYQSENLAGLNASFTYYNIDLENRIAFPTTNTLNVLIEEGFNQPFIIRNPDSATIQGFLDSANSVDDAFGVAADDVEAITFSNLQNIGTTDVSGVDFSVSYEFDIGVGAFVTGISGSYIADFIEQFEGQPTEIQGVDIVFRPADWRLRGTLGWNHNGYSANLAINYLDDYIDNRFDPVQQIDSWTTIDLSLAYTTDDRFDSPLVNGITLSLNAVNLFNEDPPFVDNSSIGSVNFDGANHNAIGRFISFQATKRW